RRARRTDGTGRPRRRGYRAASPQSVVGAGAGAILRARDGTSAPVERCRTRSAARGGDEGPACGRLMRLHINIDHVATVRQARGTDEPDPVRAAVLAELGGADGITVH